MRIPSLVLVVLCARFAGAQVSDTVHREVGATVSGVVRDSVARVPLAGAMVQLVAAGGLARSGGTAVSDSLGRFTLADVPDGRYMLGFFHPLLDTLGVESPLREVSVDGHRPVRVDLAIPSPARLRAAICGPSPSSAPDSGAVVVGVVRDARSLAPAAGATVTGEWLELSFTPAGVVRRMPRLVATTGENGWFALCNVPSAGIVALRASRGADSTDFIEVQTPMDGFLRRELYLGPSRTVVTGDTTKHGDTVVAVPRRVHLGDGRLNGTVVAAAGGRPLVGARVSIAEGPQTQANERGEWVLDGAPEGTRMLEVRAVGYYPDHRPVQVVAGAMPVRVALSTLKAVLDTVRVTARGLRFDRDRNGFKERSRSGAGHYLSAERIARRDPVVTSDLFRLVPGLRLDFDGTGVEKELSMNGPFGRCRPVIFIDGMALDSIAVDDIDSWVNPRDLAGIEVYSETTAPAQFKRYTEMSTCGSVVIWRK